MEEMFDETDDNDIPMDDIRKKNITQGKPTKFHVFKTNITVLRTLFWLPGALC
jgi:hypothetical protein